VIDKKRQYADATVSWHDSGMSGLLSGSAGIFSYRATPPRTPAANDAASETRKNDLKTKLSPPFDSNNTITFRAARSRLALQKQALGRA